MTVFFLIIVWCVCFCRHAKRVRRERKNAAILRNRGSVAVGGEVEGRAVEMDVRGGC